MLCTHKLYNQSYLKIESYNWEEKKVKETKFECRILVFALRFNLRRILYIFTFEIISLHTFKWMHLTCRCCTTNMENHMTNEEGKYCVHVPCLKKPFPHYPLYFCFNGMLEVLEISEPLALNARSRIKRFVWAWKNTLPESWVHPLASSPLPLLHLRSLRWSHAHAWPCTPR